MSDDRPQIYLTCEQIHRLGGLACDALVGIQMESTASDDSVVTGVYVDIDNPNLMHAFCIDPDGKYYDET